MAGQTYPLERTGSWASILDGKKVKMCLPETLFKNNCRILEVFVFSKRSTKRVSKCFQPFGSIWDVSNQQKRQIGGSDRRCLVAVSRISSVLASMDLANPLLLERLEVVDGLLLDVSGFWCSCWMISHDFSVVKKGWVEYHPSGPNFEGKVFLVQ